MSGRVPELPPPWRVNGAGRLEIYGPLGFVEFQESGIRAKDAEQSRWCPWYEVYGMFAGIPVLTTTVRRLQRVLYFSDALFVELPNVWVAVKSRQVWDFDLGRGDDAPYSTASRDLVDRVFSVLSEVRPRNGRWENSLRVLGHPVAGPDMIVEMYDARLQHRGIRDRRFTQAAARVMQRHDLDEFGRTRP